MNRLIAKLGNIKNYILRLLSKGDLRYCNYSLILSMIIKIARLILKKKKTLLNVLILVLRAYGSTLSVVVFFNCIYYTAYLINSKAIFCQCDNISRPKSCDTQCMQYIELLLPKPNWKRYEIDKIHVDDGLDL